MMVFSEPEYFSIIKRSVGLFRVEFPSLKTFRSDKPSYILSFIFRNAK